MEIKFICFCNGWFFKDNNKIETHKVLLCDESDSKGVSYRLEKFDSSKINQENYDYGCNVRPFYDRYGRIVDM